MLKIEKISIENGNMKIKKISIENEEIFMLKMMEFSGLKKWGNFI